MSITTAPEAPASERDAPGHEVQTAPKPPGRAGLRLIHLWAIVPLAIAWFLQSIDFIEPFDFWWNVKSGEIMAQTGRFLSTDVLVWTPIRLPYSNPQWGSQLIFYWLYNASPYLILTARTLIIVATLGVILWLCFRSSGSLRVASVTTLIAYFTGWTNYGMRPQLLAFLPFVAFLLLLQQKDQRPQWLPLLTPVMLFWVNVHGSFFLGLALMAIYALGTVIEKIGTIEGRSWLISKAALWQLLCLGAAGLVTLANPYTGGIYSYFFTATNDPIARALNIEWQAPTLYDGTGILFYSNVLIFLASAYFTRRRLRPTEILLVLAFGYLSLTSLRNVIWWGWVMAPIMAANFARLRRRAGSPQTPTPEPRPQTAEVPALNWAIAILLMGGAFLFTPLWRPANPLVSDDQVSAVAGNTPVKMAQFIQDTRPPAPLFNYMEWGGYMEWELYPQYQLFIDGRFEARQIQVWKDYLSISRARADWQTTLDRYGVKTLILSKDFHADLIRTLATANSWRKVYEDKLGAVFTRE